jgi:hypothetical protein
LTSAALGCAVRIEGDVAELRSRVEEDGAEALTANLHARAADLRSCRAQAILEPLAQQPGARSQRIHI